MAVTQFIGPKHSLRRQTSNSRSHHVGQGVGEYAVILGCVALLCVGVLSVLGSQLEGMLQGGVRFQGAPTASSLANVNNPANSAVNSAAGQPQPSNTPTTDQNPDTTTAPATTSPSPNALPDSLLHALNATSNGSLKDFSAAIETAAASGATNLYLAQLDAVIKTLEAQPTASTETIANLKALSTQGHQIAGIQKLLEEQAKANPDTFKDQQFEWNGKTYTLGQMARLVGGGASPEEVALQPFNPPQHIAMERTEVLKFINLYKQIENSNQLQPEVQQAVKKLAGNIIFSGELTEDIIGYHTSRGRIEADKIREAMLSRVTEVNANGICTIGQGKRNGQSCQ